MRTGRTRRIGWVVLLLGIVGLAWSSWSMANRLKGRPISPVFFASNIVEEKFNYLDKPIEIDRLAAPELDADPLRDWWAKGLDALRISYRGAHVDFPIVGDQPDRLPGLLDYETWFKIMPMVTGERTPIDVAEKLARGEIHSRLVAVARYPAPGFEPGTTGLVRRSEWLYCLAEFHPDADPPITVVEKTYEELDALHTPGKWTAIRHPEWVKQGADRERDLWMHYAMQQVTPAPFLRAKDRTLDAALHAMGWTWPAAGVCVLVLVTGLLMVGMGSVRIPED
ncbi:MAG: hypothetical protein KDA20_09020 [Phycisphaerales bacterium]|nr:hypothetical protein [Phycisphaerales bacterium]